MCTLSWHRDTEGYQVFFNRDERRDRGRETPPAVHSRGTTRFIAPLDGDYGGTWIAVNDAGLALCLLNGAPSRDAAGSRGPDYASRGVIPVTLIDVTTVQGLAQRLQTMQLDRYRAFVLVAVAGGGVSVARWTGHSLSVELGGALRQPLISSSFCTEEVRRSRTAIYRRMTGGDEPTEAVSRHLAFHRSHEPSRGPLSTCMHRDDASTVSFSWIDVDPHQVRFHYAPNPPCRGLPTGPPIALDRRRPG